MSCPMCGSWEPEGRCADCGYFIRPSTMEDLASLLQPDEEPGDALSPQELEALDRAADAYHDRAWDRLEQGRSPRHSYRSGKERP